MRLRLLRRQRQVQEGHRRERPLRDYQAMHVQRRVLRRLRLRLQVRGRFLWRPRGLLREGHGRAALQCYEAVHGKCGVHARGRHGVHVHVHVRLLWRRRSVQAEGQGRSRLPGGQAMHVQRSLLARGSLQVSGLFPTVSRLVVCFPTVFRLVVCFQQSVG